MWFIVKGMVAFTLVILIHQIIQAKFAYGEFFMLVMMGYIFMFRMVQKMQNSGFEIVAGLTLPLKKPSPFFFKLSLKFFEILV